MHLFWLSKGSGIASSFRLSDMLHQKELVLSTMKSAILNGGRIFLDLFMRVNRKLPPGTYELNALLCLLLLLSAQSLEN